MWLALSNKLLAWEMLQKRGFEGSGLCSLWKTTDETSSHLFASCPYAGSVWIGLVGKIEADRAHEAIIYLEERSKTWWTDERVSVFESILIFWIPLSWIPKYILKRMHKYCFTYLWRGSVDH